MRISRKKRPEEPKKVFFYNEGIRALQVLVLDDNGNLGVMPTAVAIRLARERELDLVEINPKADPPVAKIMNFGQFRYAQEKEARLRRAHQHVVETKCVRLSLRIGAHDLEIRKNQAIKFFEQGDKVKIEIILRGREMQRGQMALEVMNKFIADLNAVFPVRREEDVERQANKIMATLMRI
ncbi:MAG: translation initiation factor IF-3 [Candidatus Magasanikbacteria bacterium RIFOXYC2_FULL_42_28]|uniref:Translation initiation factor IF-3 n=1 Tax=Candidatus Magasanikbacteria bacterium RIFOXYC2_FULL_42_28 TaxID=1798704 RepID=A0A1F6NWT0_9BACT|nr:MAG: translation initiation factor IF-3 [Candidatus Magasanikbacteria bacterium RIFOXYC2_FULL_42_28]